MASDNTTAPHACRECRKLKRKCPRELPFCSLCTRLNKRCIYSPDDQPKEIDEEGRWLHDGAAMSDSTFPSLYLLDSKAFAKNPLDDVDPGIEIPTWVKEHLPVEGISSICETYIQSIHPWLPILNIRRLLREIEQSKSQPHSSLVLLLLCISLVSKSPATEKASKETLYQACKTFGSRIESSGAVSLRLLQATVLISLYEIGHGISPAAYLTVGHASRLGFLMGLHDRNHAAQLIKGPASHAMREEERRVWWSVLILDRFVHIGTAGLPLSVPDPGQSDLLPSCDRLWNNGEAGVSQPILCMSLPVENTTTPFASCCQAGHMLGRVLRHRDDQANRLEPWHRLSEALQLHNTLIALDSDIYKRYVLTSHSHEPGGWVAYAICCTARFILYGMYACNEPDAMIVSQGRIEDEIRMQQVSLEGIKDMASTKVPDLVRTMASTGLYLDMISPLICYSIYHAASECAWFINETQNPKIVEEMNFLVETLKRLSDRWGVAALYVKLLEHEDSLKTLREAMAESLRLPAHGNGSFFG